MHHRTLHHRQRGNRPPEVMDVDGLHAAFGFIARQCWHADADQLTRIQADLEGPERLAVAHRASCQQPEQITDYGAAHLAWTPRKR